MLQLPTGTLNGKTAVRDNFVRPFMAAFPGNIPRDPQSGPRAQAVEWSFAAVGSGPCANVTPTNKRVRVPGCWFYEYDLVERIIPAGRVYFNGRNTLVGAGAQVSFLEPGRRVLP
jgi:hypothetical protein